MAICTKTWSLTLRNLVAFSSCGDPIKEWINVWIFPFNFIALEKNVLSRRIYARKKVFKLINFNLIQLATTTQKGNKIPPTNLLIFPLGGRIEEWPVRLREMPTFLEISAARKENKELARCQNYPSKEALMVASIVLMEQSSYAFTATVLYIFHANLGQQQQIQIRFVRDKTFCKM